MKYNFLLFSLSILFFSCNKESKLNLNDEEEQIVVSSWLHPDSLVEVFVSKTNQPSGYFVPNAKVFLFENNVKVDSINYTTQNTYKLSYIIKPDYDYSIEVMINDEKAYAKTYIPFVPEFQIESKIDSALIDENSTILDQIQIIIQDSLITTKYYEIILYKFEINSSGDLIYKDFMPLSSKDPIFEKMNFDFYKSLLFTNESFSNINQSVRFLFNDPDFYYKDGTVNAYENSQFVVVLNEISSDYYFFKNSYYEQLENGGGSLWSNHISNIESNIQNGFGVFAGYNSSSDTLF